MSTVFDSVARTRALVYLVITALFAALILYVTVRMIAQGAGAFGVVLVGGIAIGLCYQTWRRYRRFRTPPN